ncbi:cytochrome P450 [Dendryphion nanum]|uniref:Bifunctional cytochrome P450/NADPH--P450 reductase n=1 Tax=Dendryphion nanum TaxID=256645 RepID=A0A9P9DD63_9PLEO|nr:cytochrome P450 [Dendryphion nanum]
MAEQTEALPIPQPPTKLFLGNLRDIDPVNAPASMWRLADIYGPIFKLALPGRNVIVCSSYDIVSDIFDGSRFEKPINGGLKEVRALLGDGLFTAYPGEKNWGIAHRILMPTFGPMGILRMFDSMMDIISQMLLRWDRFGASNDILCSDDFTRLAFDVIGFCAFGYRFNNFYSEHSHPFVDQMSAVLIESGKRASRLSIENSLRVFSAAENLANVKAMHDLCDQIIADRVDNPQPDSIDLLNPMLNGVDPETGEKMSKENVRLNMCTFLVAGHETTSGTLGFLFYHLLKNPEKYMKVQKEVDEILGDGRLESKHLPKLVYIKYAIYEALRFMGPISLSSKHAIKHTRIRQKYEVDPSDQILLNLRGFHHDPAVWGDDADDFRPERFLNGGYERLPPNAFKAFGDGPRACIGRGFAEQEMIMAVALIMQNFNVEMADPSYELHVKVTLTLKPDDFKIKVRRRPGRDLSNLRGGATKVPAHSATRADSPHDQQMSDSVLQPITVLYGSQAGTCKTYAEELQTNAPRFGFKATVQTLDSATEHVPKDQPVVVICPSYEGKPADNAKHFVTWLENSTDKNLLDGVQYAVFSVGNSDWADTFHLVPKIIDQHFERTGAKRITNTGFVDVKYDILGPWEEWVDTFWQDLRKTSGTTSEVTSGALKAEITCPKFATHLGGANIGYGIVKVNKDLGGKEVGLPKKHMEVELPLGSGYQSGDYITILPLNDPEIVKRIVRRFNISPDDDITISGTQKAFLLPESPLSVFDLLMSRTELGTPASQKQIQALCNATPEKSRAKLENLAKDDVYKNEVLPKRFTVIDLLEDNPDCQLPFPAYLDMLKPLTPRQYSISSSPLAHVEFVTTPEGTSAQKLTASITYDVHEEAAWSGHGQFHGVASTYMSRQVPGDRIRCLTRSTNANFHLPLDPTTPIIMVAAGSGLAPMRGFIQERATIKKARNALLGPAILYFGCRDHTSDFLYRDELQQWEKEGIVSVRPCFSKEGPGAPKHVPHRMWEDREELATMFGEQNAKIFVCGSASKLAKSTAQVCRKIYMEKSGKSEKEADEWLEKVKEDRYVTDVFE